MRFLAEALPLSRGPFLSAVIAFFSERPHECQIGSGEVIRTAVRKTFESHRARSSESSPWAPCRVFARLHARLKRVDWLQPRAVLIRLRATPRSGT